MSSKTLELENIKNQIEGMSKSHHVEILKILKKNTNVKLNENKSGIFINLSFIPAETMQEIKDYLNYIHVQEDVLLMTEIQKEEYKKNYFHGSATATTTEERVSVEHSATTS